MARAEDGLGRFGGALGRLFPAADDPDATLARAAPLGGKVLVPAMDIPGVGRFGVLQDPTGAALAVMKALPPKGE